jgi:hypothetical protein
MKELFWKLKKEGAENEKSTAIPTSMNSIKNLIALSQTLFPAFVFL